MSFFVPTKASIPRKTEKLRPALCGVSIGHYQVTAGTLGCLVIDKTNGRIAILSNNHVLTNVNEARIGDMITQPGPYDIGQNYPNKPLEEFRIGYLARFIRIKWSTTCAFRKFYFRLIGMIDHVNLVDAAIAYPEDKVLPKMYSDNLIPDGTIDMAELKVGLQVRKDGRSTCLTRGTISDIYWSGYVWYGWDKRAYFSDQIAILGTGFSSPGDSGSIITTEDGRVVGLLFAGSQNTTLANKIWNVERLLKVRVPRASEWSEGT